MIPDVVADLNIFGTHTYVQETIIDAAQKGYRIVELPSVWKKREYGGSKVVSSISKYIFYTLPILLLRSGQHIRALYTTGLFMIGFSFIYFLSILIQEGFTFALGHRTPAFILITLLIGVGTNFFFFGFILQLLKQIKQNINRSNKSSFVTPFKNEKKGKDRKET
jgi:hypothetical protein